MMHIVDVKPTSNIHRNVKNETSNGMDLILANGQRIHLENCQLKTTELLSECNPHKGQVIKKLITFELTTTQHEEVKIE